MTYYTRNNLDFGVSMLVTVITEAKLDNVPEIIEVHQARTGAFEWRIDCLSEINLSNISKIRACIHKPLIVTLRAKRQGGNFTGSEPERLDLLAQLASLSPDYMDIEYDVPADRVVQFSNAHPNIKLIRSYHDFAGMPDNLMQLLEDMRHPCIRVYKIIPTAHNTLEVLSVLHFLKNKPSDISLITHAMGEVGSPTRILGAALGNYFTYASCDTGASPAPGCLTLKTLQEVYHVHQLNPKTAIYALLGSPVTKSIGHIFHNGQFAAKKVNAVYVKFDLKMDELPAFFELIKLFNVKGCSVTMPLKEAVMAHASTQDAYSKRIGAVNTLRFDKGKIMGTNTDGLGALDALEPHCDIQKAEILLMGAGGAAKAIAIEAHLRHASNITIINRTVEKAQALAACCSGLVYSIQDYVKQTSACPTVVINTLPKIHAEALLIEILTHLLKRHEQFIYLDIDYGIQSDAIDNMMQASDCTIVPGKAMFTNQAIRQLQFWELE